jgi:hypothetical protein
LLKVECLLAVIHSQFTHTVSTLLGGPDDIMLVLGSFLMMRVHSEIREKRDND